MRRLFSVLVLLGLIAGQSPLAACPARGAAHDETTSHDHDAMNDPATSHDHDPSHDRTASHDQVLDDHAGHDDGEHSCNGLQRCHWTAVPTHAGAGARVHDDSAPSQPVFTPPSPAPDHARTTPPPKRGS